MKHQGIVAEVDTDAENNVAQERFLPALQSAFLERRFQIAFLSALQRIKRLEKLRSRQTKRIPAALAYGALAGVKPMLASCSLLTNDRFDGGLL